MNKSLLTQTNQAYLAYYQALDCNAPANEQTRLYEQWYQLYCQAIYEEAPLMFGQRNTHR